MDLLIAKSAVARVGSRLLAIDPSIRLLQLDSCGTVYRDGFTCLDPDLAPDTAWLSPDIFAQAQLPRFISVLEQGSSIRWVHTAQAGLDLPVYTKLLEKKVRLSNSHAHAPALAEYVMANVLSVFQSHDCQRQLQRDGVWLPLRFRELNGSRWLIIGLGSVGLETARRAKAFGAHVVGVRRTPYAQPSVDQVLHPDQIIDQLSDADVVVLSCPLTNATRGMVSSNFIAAMQIGSVLVNIARGALVDEDALIEGLNRGRPGFAILDVTRIEPLPGSSSLWAHEKVRLTAHSAFSGSGTTSRGDDLFVENLRRFCAGESLLHEVNEL